MSELNYRYFVGLQPDAELRCWLSKRAREAGQNGRRVDIERFHLTLCTIAETKVRDPHIRARVDIALTGQALFAPPIRLGALHTGPHGATLHTIGRREEIEVLYRAVVAALATCEMVPMHRKSGLRPHVTLGYDPCGAGRVRRLREWLPEEVVLIESELGQGVHNLLGRWPLLPQRQIVLPFRAPLAMAGDARR